jgi:molecular chaperone GrpE
MQSHAKHSDHKKDQEHKLEETEKAEEPPEESEQQKLEQQLQEVKDQLLRALAEADNVRKRAERERHEITQYAITNFARDLLTIADNLARAIESMEKSGQEDTKTLLEGVKITEKELQKVFEKYKIQKIAPGHEPFNHHFHQAMFEVETDEHAAGTIIQLLQAGYKLGERLLRPAMVGVAKPKAQDKGSAEAPSTKQSEHKSSSSH